MFAGTNIRYSGSHYRTRFDELASPGFCAWYVSKGNTVVETIDTPARYMQKIVLSSAETEEFLVSGSLPFEIPVDSDISIVAEIPEGMSHLIDRSKVDALGADGSVVKFTTKVIPKNESKIPDIHTKSTLSEKFIAWGSANNVPIPDTMIKKVDIIQRRISNG
jgi:hypothetical protein